MLFELWFYNGCVVEWTGTVVECRNEVPGSMLSWIQSPICNVAAKAICLTIMSIMSHISTKIMMISSVMGKTVLLIGLLD